MTECSELTDQIVNSLIVTLFLLGGWMLSVYGQAGPEMFDSNDDITWEVTMNDNDKVERMTKIWNAPWAMKELGWM